MSLKSVTEKIDGIITVAVLTLCFCGWAALGFPYFVTAGVAVASMILIALGAFAWTKRQQSR
jgi:hypothetical protein